MDDATESLRRQRLAELNSGDTTRRELEEQQGRVWSTQELTDEYDVLSFLAPFVVVRRKSDGARGSLEFRHSPRFYFNFSPE